jgi:hypothetical protein
MTPGERVRDAQFAVMSSASPRPDPAVLLDPLGSVATDGAVRQGQVLRQSVSDHPAPRWLSLWSSPAVHCAVCRRGGGLAKGTTGVGRKVGENLQECLAGYSIVGCEASVRAERRGMGASPGIAASLARAEGATCETPRHDDAMVWVFRRAHPGGI